MRTATLCVPLTRGAGRAAGPEAAHVGRGVGMGSRAEGAAGCSVPTGPERDDEMAELSDGEEAWEEEDEEQEQGAGEGLRARCLFCDR